MNLLKSSSQSDLQAIAECHKKCFSNSLTVKLGLPYIKKTLEWFLADSNKFLLHTVNNEHQITGYCGGFIAQYDGDGSTSGMMKYAMKEAFSGIIKNPILLFNKEVRVFYPLIFKNIFRKIFPQKKQNAKPTTQLQKRAGLVVIGVATEFRGTGVFEMLMAGFEKEAKSRNITMLSLSVRTNNTRAINAYKKVNWNIIKQDETGTYMEKQIV